mgnify:CR=1 FL=1
MAEIVNEVMNCDQKSSITYADDGSRKQGAVAFTVQGININGNFQALPTLAIASEMKENLADLKKTTLEILDVVSGVESKVLFEKIDFVMTDQTAHNLGVEESLLKNLVL